MVNPIGGYAAMTHKDDYDFLSRLSSALLVLTFLQYIFSCCGAQGVADWNLSQIPTSCCRTSSNCPHTSADAITETATSEAFTDFYDDVTDEITTLSYVLYRRGCDDAIMSYANVTVAVLALNIAFLLALLAAWAATQRKINRVSADVARKDQEISVTQDEDLKREPKRKQSFKGKVETFFWLVKVLTKHKHHAST